MKSSNFFATILNSLLGEKQIVKTFVELAFPSKAFLHLDTETALNNFVRSFYLVLRQAKMCVMSNIYPRETDQRREASW